MPAPKTLKSGLRTLVLGVGAGLSLLAIAGCGSGSEVGEGAKVAVYVSQPLCAEAREDLARKHGEAGGAKVQVVCIADAAEKGRLDLARAGAEARRATQDSTTVAFVERPGREVEFTRPILDEAGIAVLVGDSGAKAIGEVVGALDERGEKSPREAVAG